MDWRAVDPKLLLVSEFVHKHIYWLCGLHHYSHESVTSYPIFHGHFHISFPCTETCRCHAERYIHTSVHPSVEITTNPSRVYQLQSTSTKGERLGRDLLECQKRFGSSIEYRVD
jgi:hypothetical protein